LKLTTICTFRFKALKEAAKRGSISHLKKLVTSIGKTSQPHVELLPVFYRHLDVKRIPHSSHMAPGTFRTLELALTSLQGISHWAEVHLLRDKAFVVGLQDSWPKIWKWVQFFLDRCTEEIKESTAFSTTFVRNSYVTCIHLLDHLTNDADLRLTIATTSGVIHTLTQLWILETKHQHGFPGYASSIALVNFLTPLPQYAACVTGFIEASGDDPTELAAICLGRISANHQGPSPDLEALDADIRIVVSLSGPQIHLNVVRKALLERQSFAVIARTMYNLASSPNPTTSPIMFSCLTFCAAYLRDYTDISSHMMLEAIESHIIPAFLLSGKSLLQDSASTMLRDIRCEMAGGILPRYLVFRSILREADRSLKWISTRGFENQDAEKGEFGQAWMRLKAIVQDRLAIEAHSALYIVCENPAVSYKPSATPEFAYEISVR
jgi:hypothetical protein